MIESTRSFSLPAAKRLLHLLTASGAALLIGLACTSERLGPEVENATGPLFTLPGCNAGAGALPNFAIKLNCGDVVYLSTSDPVLVGTRDAVVTEWNNALSGLPGVPTLSNVPVSGARTITITKDGSATGDYWTGAVYDDNADQVLDRINLGRFTSNNPQNERGPLLNVFLHELVHIYGFNDVWDGKTDDAYYARPGVSTNCVRLTAGGVPNSSLCRHEIEDLAYAYGLRGTRADPAKHILTGLGLSAPASMVAGNSTSAGVTLEFSRGMPGGGGCGGQQCTPPAPGDLTYQWASTDPGVVGFSGSMTGATVSLVAGNPGSATVSATVTSLDDLDVGTLFADQGMVRSTVVTVTMPNQPDLRVTSITGPSSVPLYATSAVGYTLNVRNWGNATIPGGLPYLISIAMSSDAAYSANDPRVFGGSGPAPLAPYNTLGDAGMTSVFFSPPATAVPGTVYLVANLDTTNVIAEWNEGNNTGASTAITLTANGDMRVDSIYGATSLGQGETATVPVIVKNHGTDPARPAKVKVFLSTDATYSVGDVLVGSLTDTPLMTAGAKRTENVSVTIPGGQATGSYYLIARVDADSTVYESNEGNNTLVRPTQLSVTVPTFIDLTINAIIPQMDSAFYGNSYLWIKGSARNSGTASAPAGWVGRLYLSLDQTWDAGDIQVASTTYGSLAPSTNVSIATTAGVPGVAAGTDYYLIYKVDATGTVTESDEGNNIIVSSTTVYVEGLP